jgi:hypothetical protein
LASRANLLIAAASNGVRIANKIGELRIT